mmetsp:Transcript_125641/g.246228  ORF Transcript_125641/g.246228 Transcript_125641/m.246228 type:complete len:92 (+) Transcript_125641:470-745(+)
MHRAISIHANCGVQIHVFRHVLKRSAKEYPVAGKEDRVVLMVQSATNSVIASISRAEFRELFSLSMEDSPIISVISERFVVPPGESLILHE